MIQTALAALVLAGGRRIDAAGGGGLRRLRPPCRGAGGSALLGARALIEGTQRAAGFAPRDALAWSASPMVLLDALLPRFFGDVHTFSDLGYWGQPFFPDGYPYILSLYLGPCVLLLAALAGRRAPAPRLWVLVAIGVSSASEAMVRPSGWSVRCSGISGHR